MEKFIYYTMSKLNSKKQKDYAKVKKKLVADPIKKNFRLQILLLSLLVCYIYKNLLIVKWPKQKNSSRGKVL